MNRCNGMSHTAFGLAIVGPQNWGLVGLFQFSLVAAPFGGRESMLSRIVYTLVGHAGAYCAYRLTKTAPTETRRGVVQ